MYRILVVDDDEQYCNALSLNLIEEGYDVSRAYSKEEALSVVKEKSIDIVFTDLRLEESSGLDVIREIKEDYPDIIFIMITAFGTVEDAYEAGKLDVFYFISKPFSMEQVNNILKKACSEIDLKNQNKEYKHILNKRFEFSNMIGKCKSMQKVFDTIEKVSKLDVTVLITGESGTGKELVANALHYNSKRKEMPLIKVNSSAIPEALLESELFGHKKGAFTGANSDKKGRFELADKGSIFLDEIGDMDFNLQAKLLRTLQNKTIEPLGSTKSLEIDTRIITATHQDLSELVKDGKFRQDLFYRLNVVNIKLPPLRERKEDIELLVKHLMNKYNNEFGKNIQDIDKDVLKKFLSYDWPGNIRELENTVQHSMIFAEGDSITMNDLPEEFFNKSVNTISTNSSLAELEKQHIINVLKDNSQNISKTAKILGIDRKTLYNKMKKYGLSD